MKTFTDKHPFVHSPIQADKAYVILRNPAKRLCKALFLLTYTLFLLSEARAGVAVQISTDWKTSSMVKDEPTDTIQKEFVINRTTTKTELGAIQQSLSEYDYLFNIESEIFNNNDLLKIAGNIKFKQSAGKGWAFDISNFETIRITINMDNKQGKFQLDTTKSGSKKQTRLE